MRIASGVLNASWVIAAPMRFSTPGELVRKRRRPFAIDFGSFTSGPSQIRSPHRIWLSVRWIGRPNSTEPLPDRDARLTWMAHRWSMGLLTQAGNATSGQWLLRRIRSILALGGIGTGALVIALAVAQPINPSWIQPLVGLLLFWAWAAYHLISHDIRAEHRRQGAATEAARLDGASLAARTIVKVAEDRELKDEPEQQQPHPHRREQEIADDPRLPMELEDQAQMIMASAMAAAETVNKLQQPIVRLELDSAVAGPALLDINASIFDNLDSARVRVLPSGVAPAESDATAHVRCVCCLPVVESVAAAHSGASSHRSWWRFSSSHHGLTQKAG